MSIYNKILNISDEIIRQIEIKTPSIWYGPQLSLSIKGFISLFIEKDIAIDEDITECFLKFLKTNKLDIIFINDKNNEVHIGHISLCENSTPTEIIDNINELCRKHDIPKPIWYSREFV